MRRGAEFAAWSSLLIVSLAALTACAASDQTRTPPSTRDDLSRPAAAEGPYRVAYVVDGDTLAVETDRGEITVRAIGIDTPETKHPDKAVECFGPEATEHAEQLLDGGEVWLEEDPGQDSVDRYGRRLAYVWTGTESLFNLAQIAGGYAHEYTCDQAYKYQGAFRAAEEQARAGGAGLWAPGACTG